MGLADLVVVSNRGPLSFKLDPEGRPEFAGTAGGLAATLYEIFAGTNATWVSCAMNDADRAATAAGLMVDPGIEIVAVEPDTQIYKMAYQVVSNSILWFAHHHLFDGPRRPKIEARFLEAWAAYRQVNREIAEAIDSRTEEGAVVLVQDYHVTLVPGMLRSSRPDLRVVHFTHTPFADPNLLKVLPTAVAKEMLEGMAGATACGFHTPRWESGFRACCSSLGVEPPKTFVSPLAPDPARLVERASEPEVAQAVERLSALVGDRRSIIKVDRVEPSKNLLRAIWAFEELLRTRPEWRRQAVMLVLAYTSRQDLPEYLAYATEVELAARTVNANFGDEEWSPVTLEIADDPARSLAALKLYDVLLVNPLRDGMNLVAKEGPILNERDGVLALSTEAGAYEELAGPAIGLNPFDLSETAEAIALGLSMSESERAYRSAELKRLSTLRTPSDWFADQLAAAGSK